MKHFLVPILSIGMLHAQQFPTFSDTLQNGLIVIACEKPGNGIAEFEVWYKTGSKDETDGIRGMAHMFEHMMFRGSKNFPGDGDVFLKAIEDLGGNVNAYTDFDRAVYHETVPVQTLNTVFAMEADRMENLTLNQNVLDVEREVVGEELRNGQNNWFQKMANESHSLLYPEGHPYAVDVIGYLPEILQFTVKQCQDFYDKYYSPNNAFLIVVGDVKHEEIFQQAENTFGKITKQLPAHVMNNIPTLDSFKLRAVDLPVDLPVQIYNYIIPSPAANSADAAAFNFFKSLVFIGQHSILQSRLINREHAVYGILDYTEGDRLYPYQSTIAFVMPATVGNAKVKKIVAMEIESIIEEGIDTDDLNTFLNNLRSNQLMTQYDVSAIAGEIGLAQFYHQDYRLAFHLADVYEKISSQQLQAVAAKYFSPEKIQVINVKPSW